MKKIILILIITLLSITINAQMLINNSYMTQTPGHCSYSFIFYEAIYENGELVKKKLVYNVESIIIIGKDTIRNKLEGGCANLYLQRNLYNKDAVYIFTSSGFDTLKTNKKMESPYLTFNVFLTKNKTNN